MGKLFESVDALFNSDVNLILEETKIPLNEGKAKRVSNLMEAVKQKRKSRLVENSKAEDLLENMVITEDMKESIEALLSKFSSFVDFKYQGRKKLDGRFYDRFVAKIKKAGSFDLVGFEGMLKKLGDAAGAIFKLTYPKEGSPAFWIEGRFKDRLINDDGSETICEGFVVRLSSAGNPDHGENPYKAYGSAGKDSVEVDSIKAAQKACVDYITEYNLGGGNWTGGEVYEDGNYVGRISYNGRFWDKNSEYGAE